MLFSNECLPKINAFLEQKPRQTLDGKEKLNNSPFSKMLMSDQNSFIW